MERFQPDKILKETMKTIKSAKSGSANKLLRVLIKYLKRRESVFNILLSKRPAGYYLTNNLYQQFLFSLQQDFS